MLCAAGLDKISGTYGETDILANGGTYTMEARAAALNLVR